jgi:hypothetical protein
VKKAAAAVFLALNAACATSPVEEKVPVHGDTGGSCNERAAQSLIGRSADGALAVEAQRLTGAPRIRWIRPGDMVTMEYSPNRLNIYLDEQHKVKRMSCG